MLREVLRDVGEYIAALWRHFVEFLVGAMVGMALGVIPAAWGVGVSPNLWRFAILFGLGVAGFGAWREERRNRLRAERGAAADPSPRIRHEVRQVTDSEGREFAVLVIHNEGAAADFNAYYTIVGDLAELNAELRGFPPDHGWPTRWLYRPMPEDYFHTFDLRSSMRINRGDEAQIYLAWYELDRLSQKRMMRGVALSGATPKQPFAASDSADPSWFDLVLTVCSDPAMTGSGTWSRKLRVGMSGISDLDAS